MISAVNQQIGLISAQQHSYNNRKYGVKPQVLNFDNWYQSQLDQMRADGVEITEVLEVIFIKFPGKNMNAFLKSEFLDEYKHSYLRQPRVSISEGVEA